MDSVMFSQDPLSGVYSGMMPCSNNHTTKRAVRCPGEVVHDQQQAQWWQLVAQRRLDGQTRLPALPCGPVVSPPARSWRVATPPEWPVTPPPTRRARPRLGNW